MVAIKTMNAKIKDKIAISVKVSSIFDAKLYIYSNISEI